MSDIAIKVENLSKRYEIGSIGTGSLARDIQGWMAKFAGKQDPNKLIDFHDQAHTRTEHWALKDVSFEIKKGEAVGIIGKNGAGKSTLLKILSRVTTPTLGTVKVKGRIASLLEVGTGFHGDLSGRENIFMNGAILGMTKREIQTKLDEIIDFSGVEKYIDTPVKRYSSGMYVRLAFAVAAYLEPDILVVDEVLAVGDAEFQKKCLGKMNDVSKNEGRTVIFVSHNMGAIRQLCSSALLFDKGEIICHGNVESTIATYQDKHQKLLKRKYLAEKAFLNIGDDFVKLIGLKIIDTNRNEYINEIEVGSQFGIEIIFEKLNNMLNPVPNITITTSTSDVLLVSISEKSNFNIGINKTVCWIPENFLNNGNFIAILGISTFKPFTIHLQHEILITVIDNERLKGEYQGKMHGFIRPRLKWD